MKNVSRGLLALVAAVSIGALPSAAHAERVVHKDAHGDVTYQTYDPDTDTSGESVDPTVKAGDILRTVVRHKTDKVFVAIDFADLRRSDATGGHFLRLVTNEGLKRNAFLEVTRRTPAARCPSRRRTGRRSPARACRATSATPTRPSPSRSRAVA